MRHRRIVVFFRIMHGLKALDAEMAPRRDIAGARRGNRPGIEPSAESTVMVWEERSMVMATLASQAKGVAPSARPNKTAADLPRIVGPQ